MRWVKRGLWLAAWGAWLWCGFGLHRALPRTLGPPLCKLSISTGESVLGFVAEDLVVSESNALAETTAFTVWDVSTQQVRHHVRGPLSVYPQSVAIQHGVVIGIPCREDAERPDAEDEWHALDLAADDWRSLGVGKPSGFFRTEPFVCHLHPNLPWVALGARDGSNGLVVVDLRTGKRVATLRFMRKLDDPPVADCCWLGGDELLVVRTKPGVSAELWLERWDVRSSSIVASTKGHQPSADAFILGAGDAIILPGTGFAIHHTVGPFVILDPRTGDECGVGLEAVSVDSLDRGRSLPSAIGTRFPVAMGANATLFAADGVVAKSRRRTSSLATSKARDPLWRSFKHVVSGAGIMGCALWKARALACADDLGCPQHRIRIFALPRGRSTPKS